MFDDEVEADGEAGGVFGEFAVALGDAGAELGGGEGLGGEGDDDRDEGQVRESEAEADRQLVEADGDAEADQGGLVTRTVSVGPWVGCRGVLGR